MDSWNIIVCILVSRLPTKYTEQYRFNWSLSWFANKNLQYCGFLTYWVTWKFYCIKYTRLMNRVYREKRSIYFYIMKRDNEIWDFFLAKKKSSCKLVGRHVDLTEKPLTIFLEVWLNESTHVILPEAAGYRIFIILLTKVLIGQ